MIKLKVFTYKEVCEEKIGNQKFYSKRVDRFFEFDNEITKETPIEDIINTENKVFENIRQYITSTKQENNYNNLDDKFKLIRMIRRNSYLEEEIENFRQRKPYKDFKKLISAKRMEYVHCFHSDTYYYPDYLKYNYQIPKNMLPLIREIFNRYDMHIGLKKIFIDLLLFGNIPLDKINISPFDIEYKLDSVSINIYGKISSLTSINNFIEENYTDIKEYLDNKHKYSLKNISNEKILLYDMKLYKGLSHKAISSNIKKLINDSKIKYNSMREGLKEVRNDITSIFKIKDIPQDNQQEKQQKTPQNNSSKNNKK